MNDSNEYSNVKIVSFSKIEEGLASTIVSVLALFHPISERNIIFINNISNIVKCKDSLNKDLCYLVTVEGCEKVWTFNIKGEPLFKCDENYKEIRTLVDLKTSIYKVQVDILKKDGCANDSNIRILNVGNKISELSDALVLFYKSIPPYYAQNPETNEIVKVFNTFEEAKLYCLRKNYSRTILKAYIWKQMIQN